MARRISWVGSSYKDFTTFPQAVQEISPVRPTSRPSARKRTLAKPMKGLGPGVFEIAVPYRKDAYRAVYAVKLGEQVYVLHAFQKRATQGIKTPKRDIDLIRSRLRQVKEQLG